MDMKENDNLSIMIEIKLHVKSYNISSIIYIGFIGPSNIVQSEYDLKKKKKYVLEL